MAADLSVAIFFPYNYEKPASNPPKKRDCISRLSY